MNTLSYIGPSGQQVAISGINEGPGSGTMSVCWKGMTVELLHLTIEGFLSSSQYEHSELVAQTASKLYLHIVQNGGVSLFFETRSFEEALRVHCSFPEQQRTREVIESLFHSSIGAISASKPWGLSVKQLEELRLAMNEELVAVWKAIPKELRVDQRELLANGSVVVDWVESQLPQFMGQFSQSGRDWVKLSALPFPIRIFKDQRTGESSVDISLGSFDEGSGKIIKSVILLEGGKVQRSVRAAPRKIDDGRPLSRQEVEMKREQIHREVEVSLELLHLGVPHVVLFRDVRFLQSGMTKHRFYMERFEGCLEDLVNQLKSQELSSRGSLSLEYVHRMLLIHLQILDALRYLHAHRRVHRDLKLENILLRAGMVYVTDFAFSLMTGDKGCLVGTLGCISPELFDAFDEIIVSPESDMWAFGLMLCETIQEEAPAFQGIQEQIIAALLEYSRVKKTLSSGRAAVLSGMMSLHDCRATMDIDGLFSQQLEEARVQALAETEAMVVEFTCQLQRLREMLKDEAAPLKMLIWRLLSPLPAERPTAQEAYECLQRLL